MNVKSNTDNDSAAVALSVKYFRTGLYCSEAVLKAFNEVYDLGLPEEAYKIMTGFGSGLGGAGCSCGAVTGAVAVLGLVAGRTDKHQSVRISHKSVKNLHDRFRDKNRSLCCRVLVKPAVQGTIRHKKLCESYVLDAARIADEIIRTEIYEYLPRCGGQKIPDNNFIRDFIRRLMMKKKLFN